MTAIQNPTAPQEIDITRDVFRGSVARSLNLLNPTQLRGNRFQRLFQDVYVHSDVEITHELRCRGAALIARPQAVLTGRSAATVHGIPLAEPYDPIEFVVPSHFAFGPLIGIQVRRMKIGPYDADPWAGIRIARPLRIALDLLLEYPSDIRRKILRSTIVVPELDAYMAATALGRVDLERAYTEHYSRRARPSGLIELAGTATSPVPADP